MNIGTSTTMDDYSEPEPYETAVPSLVRLIRPLSTQIRLQYQLNDSSIAINSHRADLLQLLYELEAIDLLIEDLSDVAPK